MAALGDKNIRWFDVAMDDAFGVRGVEPVGYLDGQIEHGFDFHRPATDAVLQRLAVQKFHDDEGLPVLLADFVNRADVG